MIKVIVSVRFSVRIIIIIRGRVELELGLRLGLG